MRVPLPKADTLGCHLAKNETIAESKALLSNLSEIVTDISVAHNGVVPVFDTLGIGDTSELLKTLVLLNKKDTVSDNS